MKKNHRIVSLLLAALMAIGLMTTAFAAEPTINTGKRASLNIYKYDITTASADGAWDAESYVSTGLHDDAVIDKLAKYAVQGVEFTYLRVADIAMNNELVNGRRRVGVLYGFDGADTVLSAIERNRLRRPMGANAGWYREVSFVPQWDGGFFILPPLPAEKM